MSITAFRTAFWALGLAFFLSAILMLPNPQKIRTTLRLDRQQMAFPEHQMALAGHTEEPLFGRQVTKQPESKPAQAPRVEIAQRTQAVEAPAAKSAEEAPRSRRGARPSLEERLAALKEKRESVQIASKDSDLPLQLAPQPVASVTPEPAPVPVSVPKLPEPLPAPAVVVTPAPIAPVVPDKNILVPDPFAVEVPAISSASKPEMQRAPEFPAHDDQRLAVNSQPGQHTDVPSLPPRSLTMPPPAAALKAVEVRRPEPVTPAPVPVRIVGNDHPGIQVVSGETPHRKTVRFDDVPVSDVLGTLGRQAGWNVVVGADVSGNYSGEFRDMDPSEAFALAVKLHNCTVKIRGKTILVNAKESAGIRANR